MATNPPSGDTAVGNATAAPDAEIVVFSITWESVDATPAPLELFVPVPAGKYPFAQPSGASSIQATGYLK